MAMFGGPAAVAPGPPGGGSAVGAPGGDPPEEDDAERRAKKMRLASEKGKVMNIGTDEEEEQEWHANWTPEQFCTHC